MALFLLPSRNGLAGVSCTTSTFLQEMFLCSWILWNLARFLQGVSVIPSQACTNHANTFWWLFWIFLILEAKILASQWNLTTYITDWKYKNLSNRVMSTSIQYFVCSSANDELKVTQKLPSFWTFLKFTDTATYTQTDDHDIHLSKDPVVCWSVVIPNKV